MTDIPNRQAVSEKLIEVAHKDPDVVALTSDSRGSSKMVEFAETHPEQFVEVGIAEQNLVGVAAGLAASGKKPFITSYAAFLTMRSLEQIKIDVAYSKTNVKIIGISGGVSYGPLGLSHITLQDIAAVRSIPNIAVILPADRYECENLIAALIEFEGPVYVRIGRNPVPAVYRSGEYGFTIGEAVELKSGSDLTIISCGELVCRALAAAELLAQKGIQARVLNMHTIKPLDKTAVLKAARETGGIITVEEHSVSGGLGSAVAEFVVQNCPVPMKLLAFPDEVTIAGHQQDLYRHYGLDEEGITREARKFMECYCS